MEQTTSTAFFFKDCSETLYTCSRIDFPDMLFWAVISLQNYVILDLCVLTRYFFSLLALVFYWEPGMSCGETFLPLFHRLLSSALEVLDGAFSALPADEKVCFSTLFLTSMFTLCIPCIPAIFYIYANVLKLRRVGCKMSCSNFMWLDNYVNNLTTKIQWNYAITQLL